MMCLHVYACVCVCVKEKVHIYVYIVTKSGLNEPQLHDTEWVNETLSLTFISLG